MLCLDTGVSHELDSHLSQQNLKKKTQLKQKFIGHMYRKALGFTQGQGKMMFPS